MDKAAKQEAMLRRAQLELEERKEQEQALARQVRAKEEDVFALEEKYASKQDEADDKTRKLKKLWQRLQSCQAEAHDVQEEFQREREDMLDTIRELSKQLKLKEFLMKNFIPIGEERKFEVRATWNNEEELWDLACPAFSHSQHHFKGHCSWCSAGVIDLNRDYTDADEPSSHIPNPYHNYDKRDGIAKKVSSSKV